MRVRGYVSIGDVGEFYFHNGNSSQYFSDEKLKTYTFELEVPHPLLELKVIGESVEEVKVEEKTDGQEKA